MPAASRGSQRADVVLEGLGRQLDPSLDLFSVALELMPSLLMAAGTEAFSPLKE